MLLSDCAVLLLLAWLLCLVSLLGWHAGLLACRLLAGLLAGFLICWLACLLEKQQEKQLKHQKPRKQQKQQPPIKKKPLRRPTNIISRSIKKSRREQEEKRFSPKSKKLQKSTKNAAGGPKMEPECLQNRAKIERNALNPLKSLPDGSQDLFSQKGA